MQKIIPLVLGADPGNRRLVTYEKLLDYLHTPPIHPKTSKCPEECQQQMVCHRIRETIGVLKRVVEVMSREFPIFHDSVPIIVGSLKEGANIGDVDETDVLLILDEKKCQYKMVQLQKWR